jgi:hypothetical protein
MLLLGTLKIGWKLCISKSHATHYGASFGDNTELYGAQMGVQNFGTAFNFCFLHFLSVALLDGYDTALWFCLWLRLCKMVYGIQRGGLACMDNADVALAFYMLMVKNQVKVMCLQ